MRTHLLGRGLAEELLLLTELDREGTGGLDQVEGSCSIRSINSTEELSVQE